ncbi:MAG: beta-ketoacyl synthase N-terminal-like domain-containing protein, partial [Chloroflexota bacterium]|nr:beta-ketoacyl synthase N-terminal-like domain-containing protein [Chloroflexota bacterium]
MKRVVITGMATINPLGDTLEDYYQNLIHGKSGIKRWHSIDVSRIECKVGGDLGDYDCQAALDRIKPLLKEEHYKSIRKLFRTATFSCKTAVLCALNAYIDAGLLDVWVDPFRTSVLVAGHNLNANYFFNNGRQFQIAPELVDPLGAVQVIDSNVPATISEVLGLRGPTFTLGGACASGNLALRDGFRDIMIGECD